jgi:protein-S-isoprenylcysteine O-methyltransferase Ste14
MSRLHLRAILVSVLWFVFIGALVFWPAGTIAFAGGWAFIILLVGSGLAITSWLAKYSPGLLRERMGAPVQRDQKSWDRIWSPLFVLGFCVWIAIMSRDAARTGFTAVPIWGQVLGGLGVVACMLGSWWTLRVNAFAAPVVKVQEGQKVIDTGPYSVVRHPMYASALPLFVGLPLLLGSRLGLALSVVFVVAIAWRAVQEEGVLRRELPGYDEYARRVRYRMIPGIW